ncbi:serine/threonine protein kinase [Sphingomonas sp. So64.6b]|uniref:serine/threonine-protein kinase n=1 Tax=Sphingomonas sp. So64.6b TaxID=2997354 RepID=UPI0016023BD1|nr:serine/threonine-protein kinase [Sphingomonas sp. So64.6b]QNA83693.1 serine/threonine protein kinase [Sphingomonas sp. So64.6b]
MTRKPTQSEWAEISRYFDTLVDLPGETREAKLGRLKADPFVVDQLRSLLQAESAVGVLDTRAPATGDAGHASGYASLSPDTIVGGFRVERLIGRGGMGEVYLAHRDGAGFAQRVALKMLRPEAAGRVRMFDAERRLLASLEHPGIARLIDGGVAPDGRPYMALEYVEGREIAGWCGEHRCDLPTRLKLFLELCDAVEHAHAHLVLHLDIKPSNIMIDSDGRARLLDFGVAKIVDAAALDRTMTQALLTPDYAAPEQFGGGRPTVATDVYALGAVLFELLAGRGPWQFDDAPLPTVLRRLLHDDPDYPSRATTDGAIPAARLKGDLDAIVMKAMRRNPADRYASVAALAIDVRRYIAFEPVSARGGTTAYRARRFLRRNRWAAAAATVALLVLVGGVAGIAWQARKTAVERDIARGEARKAEAVNNAMSLMFRNAKDFGAGGSTTARDLLDDSAKRLVESHDPGAPDTAAVVSAVGELYTDIGDVVGAETLLDRALAKGVGKNDPAATAKFQMDLGTIKAITGKLDEAEVLLDRSDRVWATDPERFRSERLEATGARAQMLRMTGSTDAAIKLLTDSLPEAEREYAENPRKLLIRYNNLAVHLVLANKLDALSAVLKRAEAAVVRLHQEGSPLAISLLQLRGGWYSRTGDQRAALGAFRRCARQRRALYGPSSSLASDLMQVGLVMLNLNEIGEAVPVLQESSQMAATYSGAESQIMQNATMSLGGAYARLGEVGKARAALAGIEPIVVKQGRETLLYGIFLRARFELNVAERRFSAAKTDLDAAERIFRTIGAPAQPFVDSIKTLRGRLAGQIAAQRGG